MKKISVCWCACVAIGLGLLCGCETVTVPPTPPPSGSNYNALALATDRLISKMRSSPAFNRNHASIVEAKGHNPVVVVKKIDLLPSSMRLDPVIVFNTVQTSLNNSGLFCDIKDDGFYEAVDYQVTGYIKFDYDGANPRLYLKILDFNSGKIIWSDTEYNLKL